VTLLETGADIVVLRHPDAIPLVQEAINGLMATAAS
jgi:hypothetical protein